MEVRRTIRSPLFWLVVLNIILRSVWLVVMHPPQKADFDWYFTRAVELAHGEGYVWGGHPTAYWPVGWPFFLSLALRVFGPHVTVGFVLNALLSVGIVCLVYGTAVRVFHSRFVAMSAGLGYTLLPSQIQWNAVLGSEELFTFLLMLSLYIYLGDAHRVNRPWVGTVLCSGFVMGLACDVRPLPLLFPIFMFAWEWWVQRRRFRESFSRVGAFVLAMLAGVFPVTLRNLLSLHHWVLVSTNGGVNLWQGTQIDNGYFWPWDSKLNPLLAAHGNEILQDQIGKHVAMQQIIWHPIITLNHGWLKICALYHTDTNAVWYTFNVASHSGGVIWAWDWIDIYAYWAFMALAAIGLLVAVIGRIRGGRSLVFLLSFALYYTLEFLFFPAWDRFRYPLMPIYALLLGLCVRFLFVRTHRQQDLHQSTLSKFT